MSKLLFNLFLIALLSTSFINCDDSSGECSGDNCINTQEDVVLLYGSNSCGRCTSLSNGLEINGVPHTFYDVNDDYQIYEEMNQKFYEVFEDEQLIIPVVDVNGTILNNPSVLQVKKYLYENQDQ